MKTLFKQKIKNFKKRDRKFHFFKIFIAIVLLLLNDITVF